MAFKLSKGLEKVVLSVASSLIILGSPLYSNAQEQKNPPSKDCSIFLDVNDYAQREYTLPYGKRDTKKVFLFANRKENSLEIIFGVNESEQAFGKKINTINLTPLDQGFSRFVLFYPKKIKISEIEQEAYILPHKKFVELKPLEKTKFSKTVLRWGEDLVDSLTPFFVINPVKEIKDKIIELSLNREEEKYLTKAKELEKLIGEEYTFENVEFFQVDGTGYIERKRKIKTIFDTRELEGMGYIKAMLRPAIGNSTTPERTTGKWTSINFLILGEKIPAWIRKQEIGAENISSIKDLEKIMKKRATVDAGAYDPKNKRAIIYSINEDELKNPNSFPREAMKNWSFYLGIGKDLEKEKFSKKSQILFERNFYYPSNEYLNKFYNSCRGLEEE